MTQSGPYEPYEPNKREQSVEAQYEEHLGSAVKQDVDNVNVLTVDDEGRLPSGVAIASAAASKHGSLHQPTDPARICDELPTVKAVTSTPLMIAKDYIDRIREAAEFGVVNFNMPETQLISDEAMNHMIDVLPGKLIAGVSFDCPEHRVRWLSILESRRVDKQNIEDQNKVWDANNKPWYKRLWHAVKRLFTKD